MVNQICSVSTRLLGLFMLVSACSLGATTISPRIVGGQNVEQLTDGMVSLQVWRNGVLYHFCGASVIAPQWLLTAAHCVNAETEDLNHDGVEDLPLEAFYNGVRLSESNDYARRVAISRILIHPQFNAQRLTDDIALLYLAHPINSVVNTLGAGSLSQFRYGVSSFKALGWGADNEAGDHYPNQLKQVNLLHQPCPYSGISGSIFCAGGEPLEDTCFGDSGGPVLFKTEAGVQQFGIVSFGAADACGLKGLPAAFTFVPDYRTWVAEQRKLLFSNAPIFALDQRQQTVTLNNASDRMLTISQITINASDTLTVDDSACLGQQLLSQQSCQIGLTLQGDPARVHQIELVAYADDGSNAQLSFTIALTADNSITPQSRNTSGGGGVFHLVLLLILTGVSRWRKRV